jgi:DNA polymerase-3 subunit epsilon
MKQPRIDDLIVIDVETSGVNPFRHQLLSVALSPFDESLQSEVVYIRHEKIEWTPFALQNFSKFAADWERSAMSPESACEAIERYLRRLFPDRAAVAVGHNIGFDIAFLRQLAFLGGRDELEGLSHRSLDTHTMLYLLSAAGRIPASALTSDGAFEHFNIEINERDRHTAPGDVVATRDLLRKLLESFNAGVGAFYDDRKIKLPR